MAIFDTHTHYDDEAFEADRDSIVSGLPAAGVGRICNIGESLRGTRDSIALAHKYDFVYAAAGVHPDCTGELEADDEAFSELRKLAEDERVVAIGEIGLDYHGFGVYEGKPGKDVQQRWFSRQLGLAIELHKPVVIHSRNAAADTMEMMKKAKADGLCGAVIHCYSYSKEQALEYIDMGFYLGIGGVLTYEGQKKLTRSVEAAGLESLLLETDCPYLTPMPVRSGAGGRERNNSTYLCYVRDRIAELKNITPDEVERVTWDNACRFYGIEQLSAVLSGFT